MWKNDCKRVLMGLLALGLAAGVAQAGTLAEVKEKGVLRVAVYKDFPPYSYTAGGVTQGVDVDIARVLAERLGVGLSTMSLTASDESMEDDLRNAVWKGHYLGGGTADVMMHVPVDRAFAEKNDQVAIFGPYFREQIGIAHDTGRLPQVSSLLVFAREKIGVELETLPDTFLGMAERGRLRHNVVHYRTITQACSALKAGEVPALMAPQAQLEDCLQGARGRFAIAPVPQEVALFNWTVGMAVKADNPELSGALQQTLEQLREDGTLREIFARRGISYVEPAADAPAGTSGVQ